MTEDPTIDQPPRPVYGPGWTNAATLVDGTPASTRERLGRYELIAPLGTGGMGEVFLAELCGPHAFRKRVAIKRLRPDLESDPIAVSRFAREAQLAARLTHPAICQAFELGYDAGTHYIVMEHLDGTTLARVLTQLRGTGTALPLPVVVRVIEQVCAGLATAHALRDDEGATLGLVHRDVSPSNIAITRAGEVKLLDFGVAKVDHVRTQTGVLRGKFGYMSPEQIANKAVDRRTDVFAVGVVLFEALTGRRLYGQAEPRAIAAAILRGEVPDVRALRPDLPVEVGAVVARALARRRSERFASALHLRRALLAASAPRAPAAARVLAKLASWSADAAAGEAPTMVALALPAPRRAVADDDPTEITRATPPAPPPRELAPPPWRDLPVPVDDRAAPRLERAEPTAPVSALRFEPTAPVALLRDRARLLRLATIAAIATVVGALVMAAL